MQDGTKKGDLEGQSTRLSYPWSTLMVVAWELQPYHTYSCCTWVTTHPGHSSNAAVTYVLPVEACVTGIKMECTQCPLGTAQVIKTNSE